MPAPRRMPARGTAGSRSPKRNAERTAASPSDCREERIGDPLLNRALLPVFAAFYRTRFRSAIRAGSSRALSCRVAIAQDGRLNILIATLLCRARNQRALHDRPAVVPHLGDLHAVLPVLRGHCAALLLLLQILLEADLALACIVEVAQRARLSLGFLRALLFVAHELLLSLRLVFVRVDILRD